MRASGATARPAAAAATTDDLDHTRSSPRQLPSPTVRSRGPSRPRPSLDVDNAYPLRRPGGRLLPAPVLDSSVEMSSWIPHARAAVFYHLVLKSRAHYLGSLVVAIFVTGTYWYLVNWFSTPNLDVASISNKKARPGLLPRRVSDKHQLKAGMDPRRAIAVAQLWLGRVESPGGGEG